MVLTRLALLLLLPSLSLASNLDKPRAAFLETVLDSSTESQNYCKVSLSWNRSSSGLTHRAEREGYRDITADWAHSRRVLRL